MTERSDTGFAGLRTLISNVETAIRDAERRAAEPAQATMGASGGASSKAPGADYVPRSPAVPRRPDPPSTFRWGKLAAITVVVVLIVMYSMSYSAGSSTQTRASEPVTTSEPTAITEEAPSGPVLSLAPAPDSLYQVPPIPGDSSRLLDIPEIQYCLAEEIRMSGAEGALNKYSGSDIDRFNELVQAYNDQCGRYQYRRGAVDRARAAVEPYREKLTNEGRARFRGHAGSGDNDSAGDPMEMAPAAAVSAVLTVPDVKGRTAGSNASLSQTRSSGRKRDDDEVAPEVAEAHTRGRRAARGASSALYETYLAEKRENLRTCSSGENPILCKYDLLTAAELIDVRAAERRVNLRTCRTGENPILCRYEMLSAGEQSDVRAAESRVNLRTCLTGENPILCHYALLSPVERLQVKAAERQVNLRTCRTGENPILCRYELLSGSEVVDVKAAERRVNLRTCLSGAYPILCKHDLLSEREAARVAVAERRNQ